LRIIIHVGGFKLKIFILTLRIFKQYINIIVIDQSLIFTIFHAFDKFFQLQLICIEDQDMENQGCPKSIFNLQN